MLDLLFFECDDNRYAVAASDVEAVVWLPALSPLDGVAPWLIGHLNWHGRSVPVVDLGRLLGHSTRPRSLNDQLIILGVGQDQLAVLVSHVDQLTTLDEMQIVASNMSASKNLPFRAELREGDRLVMLLDVAALVRCIAAAALPDEALAVSVQPEAPPTVPAEEAQRFLARMRHLAEVQSEQVDTGRLSYALVQVGERRYAIPLIQVVEFARLQHYAPLPGVPSFIVGCMNLRGEIMSIVDLDRFLHGSQSTQGHEVVVLSAVGKRLAVRICGVERMIESNASAVQSIADTDEQHPLARQLLHLPDMLAAILDVESLLKGEMLDVFEQI